MTMTRINNDAGISSFRSLNKPRPTELKGDVEVFLQRLNALLNEVEDLEFVVRIFGITDVTEADGSRKAVFGDEIIPDDRTVLCVVSQFRQALGRRGDQNHKRARIDVITLVPNAGSG